MVLSAIEAASILKQDSCFSVQRVLAADGRSILVKHPSPESAATEEALLEREFELFQSLGSPHTLTPLGLTTFDGKGAAVFRDFDGEFLASDGSRIEVVVSIVRSLCKVLEAVHRSGRILVGMTPKSFLWRSSDGALRLVDAPFARALSSPYRSEPPRSTEHWLSAEYLPYVAPEVFGHGPAHIDARADLYSLGAVVYELLCGRPPFVTSDPAELRQCHMAKQPPSLAARAPEAPAPLVELVMRLLAKSPLDRFPDATAVDEELLRRVATVSAGGEEGRARSNPPRTFAPAEKLYGRERLLRSLRERIAARNGAPLLAVLLGEGGIGKTAVLREIGAGLLDEGAYIGFGRFARAEAGVPLSGWSGVLAELADVVLTQDAPQHGAFRDRIASELGDMAALVTGMVPAWRTILGAHEATPFDHYEAGIPRLALAIQRLLACFATAEAPVVLLLDDLQWADPSSLAILESVLTSPERLNLVVVSATRDHPGGEASVVRELEAKLRDFQAQVVVEPLAPLTAESVECLLVDAADVIEDASGLARILVAKTGGSPFFLRELLRLMLERELVFFDVESGTWRWKRWAVQTAPIAENVVAFLASKLESLGPEVVATLRTAACLGPKFCLDDFCTAASVSPEQAERRLFAAAHFLAIERVPDGIEAGDVERRAKNYEFVHDRLLEACKSSMPDDLRAGTHLAIGEALRRKLSEEPREEELFKVLAHFNVARPLVVERRERYQLAELNLKAGAAAKQRGAFSQALDYFHAGLGFLNAFVLPGKPFAATTAWVDEFKLTLALHEGAAEAALLSGDMARVDELCDAITANATSPLEKVQAYDFRISKLKGEKKFSAAVDVALEILTELDVTFPRRPTTLHAIGGFIMVKRRLLKTSIPALLTLPVMQDRDAKAAARIVESVYPAAYLGRPTLYPLLVYRHVDLSLRYGNENYSSMTYTSFAVVLCAMGDFDTAFALGGVGLELLKQFRAERLKARVYAVYYFLIFPWRNHITKALPFYAEAIQSGLAHGDFEFACYTMTFHSLVRLHSASPLALLGEEAQRFRERITALGQERSILLQSLVCQLIHDLQGEPSTLARSTLPLSGPFYDEAEMLPRCREPLDVNLVFHNHFAKLVACVLLADRGGAVEAARLGRLHFEGAFANYLGVVFEFYESLALLDAVRGTARPAHSLRRIARNQRRLRQCTENAPMNTLNKYHLIEAERLRVAGKRDEAAEHYEKAIEFALSNGFLHEAAMAEERAAAFYFERGMDRLGLRYLREAYEAYQLWGASGSVRRLKTDYPQHFALLSSAQSVRGATTLSQLADVLDYRQLVKSSQAISGEVLLSKLVERLLKTILEYAGAQRCVFLLERDGHLYVEAEADADRGDVVFFEGSIVDQSESLSRRVVQYAARTGRPLVLADAVRDTLFGQDPYVTLRRPRSVLCVPLLHQSKFLGAVYLENNQLSHVFNESRVGVIDLLASQAAISLTNSRFHALQLEVQQAKISPHFLFNALSSIANLAVVDGRKAEEAIVSLARIYRYMLDNSFEQLVTLDQELELVRTYLTVEKLRFGSKLEFSIASAPELSRLRIPALLIQPLVENSIRHAISPKLEGGFVRVEAVASATHCRITVQDDGDGVRRDSRGTGLGLKSIQERLALRYGDQFSFSISQVPGYHVEIEIPC